MSPSIYGSMDGRRMDREATATPTAHSLQRRAWSAGVGGTWRFGDDGMLVTQRRNSEQGFDAWVGAEGEDTTVAPCFPERRGVEEDSEGGRIVEDAHGSAKTSVEQPAAFGTAAYKKDLKSAVSRSDTQPKVEHGHVEGKEDEARADEQAQARLHGFGLRPVVAETESPGKSAEAEAEKRSQQARHLRSQTRRFHYIQAKKKREGFVY